MSRASFARTLPLLGWDPCPGSVEGVGDLARLLQDVAGDVAASRERVRLHGPGWAGRCARSYREHVAVLPAALAVLEDALGRLAAALAVWAGDLAGLQARADALEAQLATSHAAAQQEIGVVARDLYARGTTLLPDQDVASAQVRLGAVLGVQEEAQAQARRLHEEFTGRAAAAARVVADAREEGRGAGWHPTTRPGDLLGRAEAGLGDAWRTVGEDAVGGVVRRHAQTLDDVGDGADAVSLLLAVVPVPAARVAAVALSPVGAVADATLALHAEEDPAAAALAASTLVAGPVARPLAGFAGPGVRRLLLRGAEEAPAAAPTAEGLWHERVLHVDEDVWEHEGFVGTAELEVDELLAREAVVADRQDALEQVRGRGRTAGG